MNHCTTRVMLHFFSFLYLSSTIKALDAAVNCHQWKKAVQIIKVIDDPTVISKYCGLLGQHFEAVKDYDVSNYNPWIN